MDPPIQQLQNLNLGEQNIQSQLTDIEQIVFDKLDVVLKYALCQPKCRLTVLQMEKEVEQFISDSTVTQYNYGPRLTSYQRLLTNKISQYWGLQTRTGDYTIEGPGQIQAMKPPNYVQPEVKLSSLKPVFMQTNLSPIIMPSKKVQNIQQISTQQAQSSQIQQDIQKFSEQYQMNKVTQSLPNSYLGQENQRDLDNLNESQQIEKFYEKDQVRKQFRDNSFGEQEGLSNFSSQQNQPINPQTLQQQYQTNQLMPPQFDNELSPISSLKAFGIQQKDYTNPHLMVNPLNNYFSQAGNPLSQNNSQLNLQNVSQPHLPPYMPLQIQIPAVQQGSASQYHLPPQISPYPLTPPPAQFQNPLSQSNLTGSQNNLLYQNQPNPNQLLQNQQMLSNNYGVYSPQMFYMPTFQTQPPQNSPGMPMMSPMEYQMLQMNNPQFMGSQQYGSQQFMNNNQVMGNQFMMKQQQMMSVGGLPQGPQGMGYTGPSSLSQKSSGRGRGTSQQPFGNKMGFREGPKNERSLQYHGGGLQQQTESLQGIPTPEKSGMLSDSQTGTSTQGGSKQVSGLEPGQELGQGQDSGYTIKEESVYGEKSGSIIE